MRTDALHQRADRYDQHAALHGRQLVKGRQTGGDNILMRREAIVGQGFPVCQGDDHAVGKLPNFIIQAQGVLHIGGDEDHRAVVALGHFCDQSRAGCAGEFAELPLIAGFDRQ